MPTRREFVRGCCSAAAMGAFSGFSRFGILNALAAAPADYKALVCIFLFGGNDANNLIVPITNIPAAGFRYSDYFGIRADQSQGGLALTQAELLPVTAGTSQASGAKDFGFHPQFAQVRGLFNQNHVAVVPNVGVLAQPLTRTEYLNKTKPLPANLFSHSDQQQQWQTADTSGFGTTGWAGRVADKVYDVSLTYPPITTVAGTAIFCLGNQTKPFALSPTTNPANIGLQGYGASTAQANARLASLQELITFDTGLSLIQTTSSITGAALQQSATLAGALTGVTLTTNFPTTSIGNQLAQVARIIKANQTIGLQRQIFFCSMGGYDTHTAQISTHNNLYGQLDVAMKAFYDATVELNMPDKVTSFTLSEFGRTFRPATGAGTDHGWGSHQIVIGGAVLGGDLYGKMPQFSLSGPDDSSSNGRWIPSTSVDQFGATLARWFGVPDVQLPQIFPNLANFTTKNLGFLG